MRDSEKTVGGMIDKQKVLYVGSVDGDGFPNVKAMNAPRAREGIRTLYFSTNASSLRVAQFRAHPKACVYVCDRRFFRGVMLLGTMEVMEDPEIKARLWQTGDTMYYPQGVGDPDYCVLKFTAQSGRSYSSFHSEDFLVS